MNTTRHSSIASQHLPAVAPALSDAFREPAFDSQERREAMKLTVYVPGVDASGVEIEGRDADLIITARKTQVVRVNWQAIHLEGAQRDYRLRLRLGHRYDYAAMHAEFGSGVLTVTLPKSDPAPARPRRVARSRGPKDGTLIDGAYAFAQPVPDRAPTPRLEAAQRRA